MFLAAPTGSVLGCAIAYDDACVAGVVAVLSFGTTLVDPITILSAVVAFVPRLPSSASGSDVSTRSATPYKITSEPAESSRQTRSNHHLFKCTEVSFP
jgi:hypothetical protein